MKPRLLDLFCGAIVNESKSCYNKVWTKLSVPTAGKRLRLLDQAVRSSVHYVVTFAMFMVCQASGRANYVARHFHSLTPQIITGDIALSLVRKRLSLKKLRLGGMHIQKLTQFISKGIWLKTLDFIVIEQEVSGLKLSVYWGANV